MSNAHLIPRHDRSGSRLIAVDSPRGVELGFTSDRFYSHSYLWESDEGDTIYISAIESRGPGHFRRLAETILSLGLTVKIPTPLATMRGIVERAGYRRTIEFEDQHGLAVEVWRKDPTP